VNQSANLTELVAVGGALLILVGLILARRRDLSPSERIKIRAAAWSLLSDTPTDGNDGGKRAEESESRKGDA
jgi:hypothetical protein